MAKKDEDLDELDAIFDSIGGNEGAEKAASGFSNPEDGVYNAEILNAEYKHSKDGIPMVQIQWGLETGEKKYQYLMFADKRGDRKKTENLVAWSISTLRKLGLDEEKPRDYFNVLGTLIGNEYEIELKTNDKDFQSVTIIAGK